jgi:hypothetical protein
MTLRAGRAEESGTGLQAPNLGQTRCDAID